MYFSVVCSSLYVYDIFPVVEGVERASFTVPLSGGVPKTHLLCAAIFCGAEGCVLVQAGGTLGCLCTHDSEDHGGYCHTRFVYPVAVYVYRVCHMAGVCQGVCVCVFIRKFILFCGKTFLFIFLPFTLLHKAFR